MAVVLLDPGAELERPTRPHASRSTTLEGVTVALLDISKPRGSVFLDRIEEHLGARGILTRRYAKPTFTKPAPVQVQHAIAAECQAVIEALAD